jgi:hypothetical protein
MEIIPNYPTLVAYSLVNIVIWAYLAQATWSLEKAKQVIKCHIASDRPMSI